MGDCLTLKHQIESLLADRPSQNIASKHLERILNLLDDYRQRCDSDWAEYNEIIVRHEYGRLGTQESVARLQDLKSRCRSGLRAQVLSALALVQYGSNPIEEDLQLRKESLEEAQRQGDLIKQFIIQVNLANALINRGEIDPATEAVQSAHALGKMASSHHPKSADVREGWSRLYTHMAKVTFRTMRDGDDFALKMREAEKLYCQALDLAESDIHRLCNVLIEWAQELTLVSDIAGDASLVEAATKLEGAHRKLDAHPCSPCCGYFHKVRGELLWTNGERLFPRDRGETIRLWGAAREDFAESLRIYEGAGLIIAKESRTALARVTERLFMESRPRRIFLSHAGENKPSVAEFAALLKLLGFDPWFDKEAVEAGGNLERRLLEGVKSSCAAVFFVSPDFHDRKYIAAEIDYSIAEKRQRGDDFAIITLLLPSSDGKRGEIPDLLRPYVWKEPKSDLEAMAEILRALPIAVGTPHWRRA